MTTNFCPWPLHYLDNELMNGDGMIVDMETRHGPHNSGSLSPRMKLAKLDVTAEYPTASKKRPKLSIYMALPHG